MKITSRQTHNPPARLRCSGGNIEIIDVFGELTGREALELQEYFFRY